MSNLSYIYEKWWIIWPLYTLIHTAIGLLLLLPKYNTSRGWRRITLDSRGSSSLQTGPSLDSCLSIPAPWHVISTLQQQQQYTYYAQPAAGAIVIVIVVVVAGCAGR
jgi:hypothetical protein